MKILTFSLDPQILDEGSTTATRMRGYGEVVDRLTILIPTKDEREVDLSPTVHVVGSGGSNKLVMLWKLYKKAVPLLKKERYDVVGTQDPYYLGILGYILARRFHTGFDVGIMGLYNLTFMRRLIARYFILPRAGSMRILSQGLKDRLLSDEFGMKRGDHMYVVPIYAEVSKLGFDESNLSQEEKDAFHKSNAAFREQYKNNFNFLTVSRLIPVKNISLQLQAVAKLKAESPEILLHIVGDGDLRPLLEKEVKKLGIEDHVIFHGAKYHTELGTYFTQADCFLLTSDTEGWAMVAIEAATAGRPIIMTDVGCAGTVIKNGESGIVIPVGDEEALIASMRRVLHDSELREQLHQGVLKAIQTAPTFESIRDGCVLSWKTAASAPL